MNNIMRDISSQKYRNTKLDININLTIFGMFIFTLFFSAFKSFLLPFYVGLVLLFCSVIILVFGNLIIHKRSIILTRTDVMWILFLMIFIMNITLKDIISPVTLIDILVYFSGILFLLIVKVDINYYDYSFRLIKVLGLIYAFSAIFQYLYTDIYLSYVLPLFSSEEQTGILKLLRDNSYNGFTNQTAHTAGYIVSGIGIIAFSNWKIKLSNRVVHTLLLIVMLIGLLLTAKRAHLIFMIASIVITFLFSVNNKKFVKNIMKLVMSVIVIIILAVSIFMMIDFEENSPIMEFKYELENTVRGIIEGDDVSSGRTVLYNYSWSLFKENSITGIGWKEFIKKSVGLINNDVGSHPHNIYLQLLTELGIIGFLSFMVPVLYVFYKTFTILRKLSMADATLQKWKFGIHFSFFSQLFFILYGLTGNLLTDYNFLLIYFFSCSISLSAIFKLKPDRKNITNNLI